MRVSGACRRMASCNSQRFNSGNRGGSHDQPVFVDSLRRGLGKFRRFRERTVGLNRKNQGQIISGHPVYCVCVCVCVPGRAVSVSCLTVVRQARPSGSRADRCFTTRARCRRAPASVSSSTTTRDSRSTRTRRRPAPAARRTTLGWPVSTSRAVECRRAANKLHYRAGADSRGAPATATEGPGRTVRAAAPLAPSPAAAENGCSPVMPTALPGRRARGRLTITPKAGQTHTIVCSFFSCSLALLPCDILCAGVGPAPAPAPDWVRACAYAGRV